MTEVTVVPLGTEAQPGPRGARALARIIRTASDAQRSPVITPGNVSSITTTRPLKTGVVANAEYNEAS